MHKSYCRNIHRTKVSHTLLFHPLLRDQQGSTTARDGGKKSQKLSEKEVSDFFNNKGGGGQWKPVIASYNNKCIGTFPAPGHKDSKYGKSNPCLKLWSLRARLLEHFNGNEVYGMTTKCLQDKCRDNGKTKFGISLKYASEEEKRGISNKDLVTGFREDEPAFKLWKKKNALYKITHKKDLKDRKVDCNGIIYRTESQRSKKGEYRCPCKPCKGEGQKCHGGLVIRAEAFTVKPISFGKFTCWKKFHPIVNNLEMKWKKKEEEEEEEEERAGNKCSKCKKNRKNMKCSSEMCKQCCVGPCKAHKK